MITAILIVTSLVIAAKVIILYKSSVKDKGYERYCKYNELTKCYETCCNYCNIKSECDCCCGGNCKVCGGLSLRKKVEEK